MKHIINKPLSVVTYWKKLLPLKSYDSLTLFRLSSLGLLTYRGAKGPFPLLHIICPTMTKLGTSISYLRKTRKICESCDTSLESLRLLNIHGYNFDDVSKNCCSRSS